MPIQPDFRELHISQPLTNISVAYIQSNDVFIADKVFPNVPVARQGDLYYIYGKDDWFRSIAGERAPGTESPGGGWDLTNSSYYARVYAVHKDLDDQTRANADSMFNLDSDATNWVTMNLLLKRDQIFIANYMKTGVWGTDITGVASGPSGSQTLQWDASGSNPILDITTARLNMTEKTGKSPNILVVGARVLPALLNNASILARIQYTQPGGAFLTNQLLASALGVDQVLVAQATQNTAQAGATLSMSYMLNKVALLAYSNPTPGLMQPSAGYTFSWSGFLGAQALGTRIKRFRMENIESDRIEGEMAFDMHLVGSDLGTFYTSIVS